MYCSNYLTRMACGFPIALVALGGWIGTGPAIADVPEHLYAGELISYPGPWAFQLGKPHIILVNDQQLDDLTDPDKLVDLSLTGEPRMESLRQICERSQQAGNRTLIFAFDHFWNQYRGGTDTAPRTYMPDTDAYIERIGTISRFAAEYGIGLELSLLSPLELGPGFHEATGESGHWAHYRKGLRDPESGAYSVALWQHRRWSNNKGPIAIEDAGVRVFAFPERSLHGTDFKVVNPEKIVEITETAQVEIYNGLMHKSGDFEALRVRIHGTGRTDLAGYDRVLVVQRYRTPELDYFSPRALPFLKELAERYAAVGVKLHGLYSDEMHIQQDWSYFGHHDHGQFALRYVTPALGERFAELYGEQYRDFEKQLVYFTYAQEDTAGDLSALSGTSHVVGASPEAVEATALFRARYYRLLQDTVVDLFADAKRHAESLAGHKLEARAHATWAQSPTIDRWDTPGGRHPQHQYEYTSNFVWSNTVQQAAAACYDYFKWGDFLTGNGNDHAEGGWLDRNYYGLALACSIGSINDTPYAYGAHWGMPAELHRRRQAVADTFGVGGSPFHGLVQEMQHREVDVLMLYPMNLVAVEERFGSWMTQYGYANLITQEKLVELGEVREGALHLAGRRYTTLVALFEPFPSQSLLEMMQALAAQGGRVVWSGPPPRLTWEGEDALVLWQEMMGADASTSAAIGIAAPSKRITFEGSLTTVPSQTIPTHFIVDRIHPLVPREGTETVARMMEHTVGTRRIHPGGGSAVALGFRPRDDQAASLGEEVRTWFETLNALGAYASTGVFPDTNDNTEHLSRHSDFITCRFPNGAVAIAPHLRDVLEEWGGGFARDAEQDNAYLARVPPPSERMILGNFRVNGHAVTYEGDGGLSFRLDRDGMLLAFSGRNTNAIRLGDKEYVFAAAPLASLTFGPVPEARRVPAGAVMMLHIHGAGEVRIPAGSLAPDALLWTEGVHPGSRGKAVPYRMEDGNLVLNAEDTGGRWVFVVPASS